MFLDKVAIGKDAPNDVNVIIENSAGACPVKYELDKDSGMMFVDRFVHTPMFYPGNYGFIPHTLSGDGDPVDVLVMSTLPVLTGAVLQSRPIGVLEMEDDGGQDEKIIAVPTTKMFPYHENIETVEQLPTIQREQVEHFFTHYKDLEKGKWVKILGWHGVDRAKELIVEGIKRGEEKKAA
ncbi:MAG: inorganic diphosphatase [Bdellovibrionales bacterium]